ncbi:FkbM family methyltransferase [Escherichia coli]
MRTYIKELRWGNFILLRGDMISNYASNYGEWCEVEVDLYKTLLSEGSNVIEIGANIGLHTIPLSKICGKGSIICFEPQPPIFNMLCGNLAMNNILNVMPYNKAVGDRCGSVVIPVSSYDKPWNYGSFSIEKGYNSEGDYDASPAQQCIDLITIDAFTESTGLKVDFIKIDVEGYELNCIRGAVNTIKDNRPAIFCEAINKNITNEVVSFLSDLGYEGFWFIGNRYRQDNFFACPGQIYNKLSYDVNIIFIHKEDRGGARNLCRERLKRFEYFEQLHEGITVLNSYP